MAVDDIPDEFLDPEGDAEEQDPDFVFETPTGTLRSLWEGWMCRRGPGAFADVTFFDRKIGGVPSPAVEAFRALERALVATGYQPRSVWAYNCRVIAGTSSLSLHSAGIAIDIDPVENPFAAGDPFAGKLQPDHVSAALAIRNDRGARLWSWGGHWAKPDRMHFQLDRGPTDMRVDWSTVPGIGEHETTPDEEDDVTLEMGADNPAVKRFQDCLLAWDRDALPEYGADGTFGNETAAWVRRFQGAFGLEETGVIDGITAALLAMQ